MSNAKKVKRKINYLIVKNNDGGKRSKARIPLRAIFFETDHNTVRDDTWCDVGVQKLNLESKDRNSICEQLLITPDDKMDFVKWSQKKRKLKGYAITN